jgi:hypothetical protein
MTVLQGKHPDHLHFDESKVLHIFSLVLMVLVFLLSLTLVLTIGESRPTATSGSQNYPLPITPWD